MDKPNLIMMNKPNLIMLCGLPGSGKSTYALELAENDNTVTHSSDAIRKELGVSGGDRSQNEKVFSELHKRIKDDLRNGVNVVYDACNIHYKKRMAFLKEIDSIECCKKCVILAVSYGRCLINNIRRESCVPEDVITRMYKSWTTPYYFEGWDDISIKYGTQHYHEPVIFILDNQDFCQDNAHHSLTLGGHCAVAASYLSCAYPSRHDLIRTAMLHDCGKPFTKSFKHSNGETTDEACYYNHQNVGAHDSLFYKANSIDEKIYSSVLIQFHMHPYFWEQKGSNTEKQRSKYKKLWGEEMYDDIIALHEADLVAH